MSDFVSSFWSHFIIALAVGGLIFCLWLLYSQRGWLKSNIEQVEDTGHVWDGDLRELNNPIPRWWVVMYILTCVFTAGYWYLYPSLGKNEGALGYTTAGQVKADLDALRERVKPIFARYQDMPIPEIAADTEARNIGQRLFLNHCAQCHSSDARGGAGFPDLTNKDWLYGGEPEQIQMSISKGRHGIMPGWSAQIKPNEAADIAQYVRSMSGLASDPLRVIPGKRGYEMYCVACHAVDGKGNQAMGAPNLTDNIWIYGSSQASIVETILNGRENRMPPQEHILSEDQIRILTAWVWGLSNSQGTAVSAR
jgi:cytochrome c oxidase cbb3-type subunit 3